MDVRVSLGTPSNVLLLPPVDVVGDVVKGERDGWILSLYRLLEAESVTMTSASLIWPPSLSGV